MLNKKVIFFLILSLPFFLFLRSQNLIQVQNYVIFNIASFQIFILLLILLISFLIKFLTKKNFFNFDNLLISFGICYFLSFLFEDLKFKENFENIFFSGFLFSAIIFFLILLAVFFATIYLLNNKDFKDNFFKFISIFVLLNYIFISFNFLNFFNKKEINNFESKLTKYDLKNNENKNVDIYYIVLDEMTSLDYAEKIQVINNKNEIINTLKSFDGYYVSNSLTNYPTTHLSIQSILNLNYPITEKSKKYSTYKNFFPNTLINQYEKLPIIVLNKKLKRKFYWTGNNYQNCKSNSYEPEMCGNQSNIIHYLDSLELFYGSNLLDFLIRRINSNSLNKFEIKSTFEILNDEELAYFQDIDFSKKNLFFMHLLKPHKPYDVDRNCNTSKHGDTMFGYSENYKCVLLLIKKFVKNINNLSNKPKVIIFAGDHGFVPDQNFTSQQKKNYKISRENKIDRLKIFNLIFYPPECNDDIKFAKSPVNIIRFAFNCAENISMEYLPNKHFYTFYENHPNWGEIELLMQQ